MSPIGGDSGVDPPVVPAPIESLNLKIRNFSEGNTFHDLLFVYVSTPFFSAGMSDMFLCYLTPSGEVKRIAYGAYVIDGKYPYWFELYFFPKDGFHANDLTSDDIDAFIDDVPAKALDLENPCPSDLLPAGALDDTFLVRVVPWESVLDEEKAPLSWSFDLNGGVEPDAAPGVFDLRHSSYLYKQGDVVDAEEFAYFEGIEPVRDGYVFKGWRYRLHEREYQMDGAINPDPLGKYADSDVPYDAASGVILDEELSGVPGSDFPKTYHIAFKAVWEEETPGDDPGGDPGDTPGGDPGDTPGGDPGGDPGDTPGKTPGTSGLPKTGDGLKLGFILLGAAVALSGSIVACLRKKAYKL